MKKTTKKQFDTAVIVIHTVDGFKVFNEEILLESTCTRFTSRQLLTNHTPGNQ